VAHEQQTSVGGDASQRVECLASVEITGQRRVCPQPLEFLRAPQLSGQLRGLARTRLGAEQRSVEGRSKPRQRDARRACLSFAAGGQPARGVRARAMGLRLGVT